MGLQSKLFMHSNQSNIEGTEQTVDFACHKVVVVIPSFNEERFIGSVVLKLQRYPVTILVVDDGSSDDTAEIASRAGAMVLRQEKNQGKGAALNTGFRKALELSPDVIVMIDADGQHLPEELPQVVRPILEGQADIVVGSRYLRSTSEVPLHRVLGHVLFSWLTSAASGVMVGDTQSGYRAFSPRAFNVLQFHSHGFSVESEIQFMAHEQGLRVTEVPITVRYTDPPKRSVVQQGMSVLNGVMRLTGQYRPLLFFGLPGFLIFLAGILWGLVVVNIYIRVHELAIGYAMISVMLSVLGITLFSTGVILHSIRGLLVDMFKTK